MRPTILAEVNVGPVRLAANTFLADVDYLSLATQREVDMDPDSIGRELDARRFRPNLLIDAVQDRPFQEEEWVGLTINLGPRSFELIAVSVGA